MSRTATYHTTVRWTGEHWGHLSMGNGPEMKFSAPPDAHGHAGVLTPEDAFVAAANTCVMMMFIWATERFKLKLVSFECRTEGTKLIELDRTELFKFCAGLVRRGQRSECLHDPDQFLVGKLGMLGQVFGCHGTSYGSGAEKPVGMA